MKSSVMLVCCWQSTLEIWFIALGRWPRPVPQRCEVLSLLILVLIWSIINGIDDEGLSNRNVINANQRELIENRY